MSQSSPDIKNAFFEGVLETVAEGIVFLDDEGRIVFANPAVERLLGYEPRELVGTSVDRLFSPDRGASLEALREQASANEARFDERDVVLVHRDGRRVPASLSVQDVEYDGQRCYTVTLRDTFEHRESEHHRLEEERDRRAALFENSNDPIVEYEFDGETAIIKAVNGAFEDVFGYDAEAVVGRAADAVLVPREEYPAYCAFIEKLLRYEKIKAEVRRQTVTGPREFLFRAVRFDAGSNSHGGYAIYTDITERKEREKQLRETKEHFEKIFTHANDAIVIFDPSRDTFKECNGQACELLGYSREEFLDLGPSDVHSHELPRFLEFVDRVLDEGTGWSDEFGCRTSSGAVVPAEISASQIELDGEPHVLALVRNISERVEHERALRQRSAAMDATTDGMAILDTDGKYVYVNRAHAEMYGYADPEELVGESWQQLYDETEIKRFETDIEPVIKDRGGWRGETVGRRKDGTSVPQELVLTELEDNGWVYVVRDITDRKAIERKLEALNEASRELVTAETTGTITRRSLEAVDRVLGFDISCVRLFDSETNTLEPIAMTPGAEELVDSCPAFDLEATLAGHAYRRGETVSTEVDEEEPCPDEPYQASLHLPLGEYGTLTIFSRSSAGFEELDVHRAKLLAAAIRAALDRDEREKMLRRNERELRQQRDQLDTLNQINSLVEELIQGLVGATTREEINQIVCDRLVASDFYESAWIGATSVTGGRITPQAGAGVEDGYLEALATMPLSYIENGIVNRAIQTGEFQVVRQYQVTKLDSESDDGDRSSPQEVEAVAAIPLTYDERIYGVLVVNATREDVFSKTAQTGFEVLGDTIGFAIYAVLNRDLLLSDSVVELEFEVTDPRCVPVLFSQRLGCRCQLKQTAPLGDGKFLSYLRLEGASADDALEVAESTDLVESGRIVSEHDSEILLELIQAESVAQALMEVGASVRTVVADDGEGRLVAEAPQTANVREIVETFRVIHPESNLLAKRDVDHPVKTVAEFRDDLEDRLTDKQMAAIESAYASGYFDWPRKNTAAELAATLGISAPTLHQHLRHAERKLLETFINGV
ncbi:PAS domain S-box protein [Halegenticoccus tardaugens]|uniref:PAS domain S-box protein n=1 Tax=Halegenticoccus tardaugens TaxID=2071624 RepID=UPI00100A92B0|nr:PAS domain S-box protein [Halegenticoccus tardaugens]